MNYGPRWCMLFCLVPGIHANGVKTALLQSEIMIEALRCMWEAIVLY